MDVSIRKLHFSEAVEALPNSNVVDSGGTSDMSVNKFDTPDAETTHYLESFNIDVDTHEGKGSFPPPFLAIGSFRYCFCG